MSSQQNLPSSHKTSNILRDLEAFLGKESPPLPESTSTSRTTDTAVAEEAACSTPEVSQAQPPSPGLLSRQSTGASSTLTVTSSVQASNKELQEIEELFQDMNTYDSHELLLQADPELPPAHITFHYPKDDAAKYYLISMPGDDGSTDVRILERKLSVPRK